MQLFFIMLLPIVIPYRDDDDLGNISDDLCWKIIN